MPNIKRSILKKKYERFIQAWNNEKRYQQYLLAKGDPLEEGHQQLGRKPTFKMWLDAVHNKNVRSEEGQTEVSENTDPKKVEVEETSWD